MFNEVSEFYAGLIFMKFKWKWSFKSFQVVNLALLPFLIVYNIIFPVQYDLPTSKFIYSLQWKSLKIILWFLQKHIFVRKYFIKNAAFEFQTNFGQYLHAN